MAAVRVLSATQGHVRGHRRTDASLQAFSKGVAIWAKPGHCRSAPVPANPACIPQEPEVACTHPIGFSSQGVLNTIDAGYPVL